MRLLDFATHRLRRFHRLNSPNQRLTPPSTLTINDPSGQLNIVLSFFLPTPPLRSPRHFVAPVARNPSPFFLPIPRG